MFENVAIQTWPFEFYFLLFIEFWTHSESFRFIRNGSKSILAIWTAFPMSTVPTDEPRFAWWILNDNSERTIRIQYEISNYLINVNKINLRNGIEHIGQSTKVESSTLFWTNIFRRIFTKARIVCIRDDHVVESRGNST